MIAFVFISAALLVIIDQLIKYFVVEYLAPIGSFTVIDNLFSLVYVENRGAAFGVLQNQLWLFSLLTVFLIGVFVYLLLKKKLYGRLFSVSAALIIGGGIGNLIDRVFRGFVVDYLSISFFPPVCNFADYCITVGAALFIICLFTFEKKQKSLTSHTDGEQNAE